LIVSDEPEPVIQPTTDNGGRRSGLERRNFSYTVHVPERRSGTDRRAHDDRRKTPRSQQPDGGGVAL
jgi:hypothetical protein